MLFCNLTNMFLLNINLFLLLFFFRLLIINSKKPVMTEFNRDRHAVLRPDVWKNRFLIFFTEFEFKKKSFFSLIAKNILRRNWQNFSTCDIVWNNRSRDIMIINNMIDLPFLLFWLLLSFYILYFQKPLPITHSI